MYYMLESFTIVLNGEMAILTGIGALIILFMIPIKEFEYKNVSKIFILCFIWWMMLSFYYPPYGNNYKIYKHNADLTIAGQSAFGRGLSDLDDNYGDSFKHPAYLDYSGLQHLTYIVLTHISLKSYRFMGFGFQIWTIILFAASILVLHHRNSELINSITSKAWAALLLTFHPIFVFHFLINSWEDKLIFFVIPLCMVFLIKDKKYIAAAFIVGFINGLNGMFIIFTPVFIIHLFLENRENFWKSISIMFIGAIISFIPFFPESFYGWNNRIDRMNSTQPFWYSIYLLLPFGSYSPFLNKVSVALLSLTSYVLLLLRRINITDMIIISVSIILVLGPFNNVSRILPIILLIAVLTPNTSRQYWLSLYLILFLYFFHSAKIAYSNIDFLQVITFYIPLFWVSGIYIYKKYQITKMKFIMQDLPEHVNAAKEFYRN